MLESLLVELDLRPKALHLYGMVAELTEIFPNSDDVKFEEANTMTSTSKVNEEQKVDEANNFPDKDRPQPHRVRLPGFIMGDEMGLGNVIKRTTSYLGIQPCGSCQHRAAKLNRWLVFTPRRSR